ncbi:hypothetical protein CTAYLR_004501 [Chrysophaeum taylorii]|uniref:glycine--tRNA ligase n=1 Tax=Chrysophaeum taylorii TaxID=2483200 RepID=A0AAD7XM44_9STRA|nr:hypothetical protein CTAYLR_004501 [Chrysophaeum taylorii]
MLTMFMVVVRCCSSLSMETIVSLCRKRGFIYGSSEIYNGFNGFYDYGPLGAELKKNIKNEWWVEFVQRSDDVFGLDSSIIGSPLIWKASGHVGGFSDPMVDDKKTKRRYRADQLFYKKVGDAYVTVHEAEKTEECACLVDAPPDVFAQLPPPDDPRRPGDLTEPRDFNLMFETNVGATDASTAYLRPETAQGIFVNYKNVLSSSRLRLPGGIAQIGKAFRNEITPRNFIFRSREFEQMEIEYFIKEDDWEPRHAEWITRCKTWLLKIGLKDELLGYDVHRDNLAHYARACTDITFKFPFGEQELQGIAARGNYDLTQHQSASGKSLEFYDEVAKEKLIPHVIEPSIGVDRLFLALLCSAYEEDGDRVVLKLSPLVAPVKCAVFPLVKKEPVLTLARRLYEDLREEFACDFDVSGAIGRRYRRQDEIGTPFCVTVDFDTLDDNSGFP